MDINVYCSAFYGVYYLFIFIILEFYRIFLQILEVNVKKRPQNHMVHIQIHEKHQIMVQYQLEIIFEGIYVSKQMFLLQ